MTGDERITYEEFIIMFKNAPRLAYVLYDKAEDEIERLNNIINELEKYLKSIQLPVLRSDDMPIYKYQEVLDKLKELKEDNNDKN